MALMGSFGFGMGFLAYFVIIFWLFRLTFSYFQFLFGFRLGFFVILWLNSAHFCALFNVVDNHFYATRLPGDNRSPTQPHRKHSSIVKIGKIQNYISKSHGGGKTALVY
jgi:hypothetical protein